MNGGDANIRNVVQDVQAEIRSARVAGNHEQLKALLQTLADLPITDQQKTALNKEIAETAEASGDNQELANATELLDRIGGVVRPVAEIKEPSGGTFVMPDFSKDEIPVKEQIAFFNQQIAQMNESRGLQLGGIGRQEDALAKLALPSRSANTGWTDQYPNGGSGKYAYSAYGVGSIYQYYDLAGRWKDNDCGQAAVATLLTYHGKYPQSPDGKLQRILETKFPPDLLWGAAGTSPARVMSCANNYGLNCNQGWLQSNMEPWIRNRYPCVIVVDVGKAGGGWTGQKGLHYIVVYAYDSNNYWCTNWAGSDKVPKKTILNCWALGGWFFAATKK